MHLAWQHPSWEDAHAKTQMEELLRVKSAVAGLVDQGRAEKSVFSNFLQRSCSCADRSVLAQDLQRPAESAPRDLGRQLASGRCPARES